MLDENNNITTETIPINAYPKDAKNVDDKQCLAEGKKCLILQKEYFIVYILVHGVHSTHESLYPIARAIMYLSSHNNDNFAIHLAKDREGKTHESMAWQAKSVVEETEHFVESNEQVLTARKNGKKLLLVYVGHSLGGVVLDTLELSDEFKVKNQIAEHIFVMITAPLQGLDGNPAKVLELKKTILDAFKSSLSYYKLGDFFISGLKEVLEANFNPKEIPINSQYSGLKSLSKIERLGKSNSPTKPTLCIAAQCPGLFLLSALSKSSKLNFIIGRFINSFSPDTKQKINDLWVEMLDNEKNHDGIVPTNSQTYRLSNSKLEYIKLEGVSHKSVLYEPNVPIYIYNYVNEQLSVCANLQLVS